MVLPSEIFKDILSNMNRQNLAQLQICSRPLNQLIGIYFPVYPLRKVYSVALVQWFKRSIRELSHLEGNEDELFYVVVLTENGSKLSFHSRDVVDALKWMLLRLKSTAIVKGMTLTPFPITSEILELFAEFGPTIHVARLTLYHLQYSEDVSMAMLTRCFARISKFCLDGSPLPDQINGEFIVACKEKGVATLILSPRSLCPTVTEDGILDFLFGGSEVDTESGIRRLEVEGPTITSNFFKRLVEANMRHVCDDKVELLIFKVQCGNEQDTTGYERVREVRRNGEHFVFHEQIPFKIRILRETIEMRRGTGFKEIILNEPPGEYM